MFGVSLLSSFGRVGHIQQVRVAGAARDAGAKADRIDMVDLVGRILQQAVPVRQRAVGDAVVTGVAAGGGLAVRQEVDEVVVRREVAAPVGVVEAGDRILDRRLVVGRRRRSAGCR